MIVTNILHKRNEFFIIETTESTYTTTGTYEYRVLKLNRNDFSNGAGSVSNEGFIRVNNALQTFAKEKSITIEIINDKEG